MSTLSVASAAPLGRSQVRLHVRRREPRLGQGAADSPESVVRMWLAGPEHRAALLDPGFARVGVAAPRGSFRGMLRVAVVTADLGGTR